ncbi:MAG: Wzz/FepE/Etk N-terminal domain-containing protein [Solirubrobacteraceae bacterium]
MPSLPNSTPSAPPEGVLVPFARAIRAHPFLIVATVVVAVFVGVVVAKTRSPQYKATAQVLVTPLPEGGLNGSYTGLPVVTSSAAEPTRTLETAATVLKSPQAAVVAARAIPGWSSEQVSKAIDVEPRGESDIVSVTATAGNARLARRLANQYTNSALSVRSTELSHDANLLISQLQARERDVPTSDVNTLSQLAAQVTNLVPISNGHDPNFSLLQAAQLPVARSGSSTSLIAVLALLAGLVIGVGAALVIEFTNRRVRDEEEALSTYPLPVLARVPQLPRGAREATSFELLAPRVQEVYRSLQVQLPPSPPGRGRSIMLTSASMGDGKTASAINLALVLAAAGRKVILFDFDLRKPDVGRRLGIHADMMDLFRTDGSLDEVLVESPAAPGLRVISTDSHGDVTPLLEAVSRRLRGLLEEAVQLADDVIVDTAPLGQVSDALRVAAMVDDIVLVVRSTNTDRSELQHTRDLLERMGYTPTGMLLIGEAVRGSMYGVYGDERSTSTAPSAPLDSLGKTLRREGPKRERDADLATLSPPRDEGSKQPRAARGARQRTRP